MTKPSAKVVADSKFGSTRVVTLEVEMHRFILAENNTHKAQSRNIQSSRAIPILRQLEQITEDPAMPLFYGRNEAGMVANEELSEEEVEQCKKIILWMRDCCVKGVKELHETGLHKQISNRYVEPWMWTKGVVTATEKAWKEMFKLRCHYQAQPEIKALFEAIEKEISESEPNILLEGDLHLPYYRREGVWLEGYEATSKQDAVKISLSCVAQVSYRRLDDSLQKAERVVAMLNFPKSGVYPKDPPHFSPSEHIAIASKGNIRLSGNLQTDDFVQYRKLLEEGIEAEWIKEQ